MLIPPEYRNHNEPNSMGKLRLAAGVWIFRVTWDGAEGIKYWIDRIDIATTWATVIEPSPSMQQRSSKMIEVALTEPAFLHVQTTSPASAASINAKARVGVTVIPTAGS